MADSSSSKKVQRAARAAASSRGASERRELGFPLILGAVVVLGIILVVVANRQQDDNVASQPELTDHWHAAYSIWDCDDYLPAWQGQQDPLGIHSHQDELIHVHPFTNAVTGERAQLRVFLEAMDAELDESRLVSGQHGVLEAGEECDGEPTVWKVARFRIDPSVELVEVYDTDLDSVQFNSDREGFVIARVPADLPLDEFPPPRDAALDALDRVTGAIAQVTTTTTAASGSGEPDTQSEPETDGDDGAETGADGDGDDG